MEDMSRKDEEERNTLEDTYSLVSDDPQSGGDVLAFRNLRNDNLNVDFLRLLTEPVTKSRFSKGEVIRLESEFITDDSVLGVWFQVRQDNTRFSSYSGTEEINSRYYVELDHLDPGEYYWRVAVRKNREYELSSEYSFTIDGTYDKFSNGMYVAAQAIFNVKRLFQQGSLQPICHRIPQYAPVGPPPCPPHLLLLRHHP